LIGVFFDVHRFMQINVGHLKCHKTSHYVFSAYTKKLTNQHCIQCIQVFRLENIAVRVWLILYCEIGSFVHSAIILSQCYSYFFIIFLWLLAACHEKKKFCPCEEFMYIIYTMKSFVKAFGVIFYYAE
jgi:hypothetical protein